jgi:hypothetical protein
MCRRSWMRPSSPFCCSRSSSRVSDGSHPLCSLCLCVVLCMSSAMEFACCELSHVGVFFPRCIGDFFVTVSLPILHDGASASSVVLHNVTVTHTWLYAHTHFGLHPELARQLNRTHALVHSMNLNT